MIAILGLILIPFAIFYYEGEDEKGYARGPHCPVLHQLPSGSRILLVGNLVRHFCGSLGRWLHLPGSLTGAFATIQTTSCSPYQIPIKTMTASLVPADQAVLTVSCSSTNNVRAVAAHISCNRIARIIIHHLRTVLSA